MDSTHPALKLVKGQNSELTIVPPSGSVTAATLRRNLDAYITDYIERHRDCCSVGCCQRRARGGDDECCGKKRCSTKDALAQHTKDAARLLTLRHNALSAHPPTSPAYAAIRERYEEELNAIGAASPEPPPPLDKATTFADAATKQAEHLTAISIMARLAPSAARPPPRPRHPHRPPGGRSRLTLEHRGLYTHEHMHNAPGSPRSDFFRGVKGRGFNRNARRAKSRQGYIRTARRPPPSPCAPSTTARYF